MNAATQYRALVVDDEALVRQATMRTLSRAGFTCDAAEDGRAALEMARQDRYDLVVTDLRMPEANGHQLAVELLTIAPRPAIIILTGVAEPRIVKDLRTRGVDEILFKPIEYDIVAKKAREIVEHHSARVQQNARSSVAAGETPTASMANDGVPPETDTPHVADHDPANAQVSPGGSQSTNELGAKLTVADVERAVELDPTFAAELARYAKQKYASSGRAPRDAQAAAMAAQKAAAVRAVCTFAGGVVFGWTFSWLGLALFR